MKYKHDPRIINKEDDAFNACAVVLSILGAVILILLAILINAK